MKKLLALGIGVLTLTTMMGAARAVDMPVKQEGRVWIDQNFLLAFTPNWSLTTMPGARVEFARTREGSAGMQFIELFFGPNYTYKTGNFTLKASLWYYYMGYPQRGRLKEQSPYTGTEACSTAAIAPSTYCTSTYNASHNIEIVPAAEYRFGRWSIYDRLIAHNTFYADVYSTATPTLSVSDQRWGWGTVLRELLQVRYALTDRLGVSLADEVFLGVLEDSDTSSMKASNGTPTGFNPMGYWKQGLRYNRTYLGIDYKVTPNFTITPMYMVEIGMNPIDSYDVSDIAHTLFVVATITSSTFGNK
jgi:hypothetical protein